MLKFLLAREPLIKEPNPYPPRVSEDKDYPEGAEMALGRPLSLALDGATHPELDELLSSYSHLLKKTAQEVLRMVAPRLRCHFLSRREVIRIT